MAKSLICILVGLSIASGNIRQLFPGGGLVSPYYDQHCDVICNEETHSSTSLCATDGKLYSSQCEYRNAQCKALKTGDLLTITNYGECVTLDTTCDVMRQTTCLTHHISQLSGNNNGAEPVCGSNNKTYGSVCEFRSAQCHNELIQGVHSVETLTLAHDGECQIDLSQLYMVNCSKYILINTGLAIEGSANTYPHGVACPRNYQPICSKEHRTFSNECTFCNYLLATHLLPKNDFVTYALHDGSCTSDEIFG
ncbi:ovoinhibitor-like [Ruditapes philippinarum]|uniref:ovoinhibitor-like n=1 Tax=Ruditapes philippinarum TaxID=129788 RepID=UPI00295B6D88|nr:ovoinhibitor-like [Ruditapes philippinarum]